MRLISAALATLERSDRDASPRFSNRDPPRPPDQPPHRPTNPVPRSTTTFRGVSRLVSVLLRFAAELGFAFPHLTGLFTPVAAFCRDPRFRALHFMGLFTPVAAAPHPRFAWARTVYPRCHATPSPPSPPFCRGRWVCRSRYFAKCLDSPRRNNRPRRSRHPRNAPVGVRPALSLGARTILSPCAKCPRSVLAASLWRGNRRSPREAQTTPVSRLAVRGIVQASKERGDARQRRKTERGSFLGQPRWTGETPRSVLGGFAACVAPTSRGESVESAKHTSTARRTHHKPRPAPDGAKREQLLGRARHEPIGRGGGKSPKPPLERARHNANAAKGNTAEPSLGRRAAHFNANAAAPRRGATHNSATELGLFSHKPLGAGERNWRGVWKGDNATPNAAAPRPMGQRPSWDEHGDASRTMPHRARRGGG